MLSEREIADVKTARLTNGRHFIAQRETGHVDIVKVLLQNGADVNAVENTNGQHFTTQLRIGLEVLTLRKCCFRTVPT